MNETLINLSAKLKLKKLFVKSKQEVSIAPLIVYRILFGLMMFYGCIWSFLKGDITTRFIDPNFFFKYYGFEWIGYIGDTGVYILYLIWLLSTLGIIFGALYKISIWCFFLVFTYLHLLDATNFINHYYAISIFAFFLGILPANSNTSLDAIKKPKLKLQYVPYWNIYVFQIQIAIIYTFAAIAKINPDWLYMGMPLKIWLLQNHDMFLLGYFFKFHSIHLFMSWIGFLFDLTIIWFLLFPKTRKFAFAFVVIFHVGTGILLNIGLFPLLMIFSTTLFFSPQEHKQLLLKFGFFKKISNSQSHTPHPLLKYIFIIHFIIQIIIPLREYVLYEGNTLWTEEGYRFSWKVMLTEKEGNATFYVKDRNSNRSWEVNNSNYLTHFQEKRMSIRPDHILQYARYLAVQYEKQYSIKQPIVNGDIFVAFNGRVSQRLINPHINLAGDYKLIESKKLIYPFNHNN